MATREKEAGGNIIYADPTKDFFVNMITRDIELVDCIFDLLDNAIDGARRHIDSNHPLPFENFSINLSFNQDNFTISDNCGGITLHDAINHAFHFGKKAKGEGDVKGGIGLYGIGMKRAIFKIGRLADITSHADDASFKVTVNVDEWMAIEDRWDFSYELIEKSKQLGSTISITSLNKGIGETFTDTLFKNELIKAISRDYTFFIDKGLTINIDDVPVVSLKYGLKQNANVAPGVQSYEDNGVRISIIAGLIEDLPDEVPEEVRPGLVDRFGWYVICNDRVVLAGDKTEKTVWGSDDFQVWHPQYTGFAGFVFFQSDDQNLLPWTTTKRHLDSSSPLYRRTVIRMQEMTDVFIKYSNRRKAELENAKQLESDATRIDVYSFAPARDVAVQPFKLPSFATASGPLMVTVSYKREKTEIDEIKKYAGNTLMSNKEVGHLTFDYYREMELGK